MNIPKPLGLMLVVLVLGAGIAMLLQPAQRMPAVTFNLVQGEPLRSADLYGRSVLVSFWSVDCTVCLRDMPRLAALHASLQDAGLTVIGVAMPDNPPPAVLATVERLQPGFPIALDVHGELVRAFGGVRVTPTLFLVDPQGNIRMTEHGALDEVRLRATLATFRG